MRLNRSFQVALFLLTFLVATASHAGVKSKAFVSGEAIKTIGLLKVGEPRGYFLGEGGGPGAAGQVFGLGGLLFEQFKKPKHPEYTSVGFQFSAEAERMLTEHLKAAGFNVVSVPVKRKKPYQLLDDYNALSVPNVDAYLDIASGGIGYRKSTFSAFPGAARKVGPVVNVIVQLVSAHTKKVLYAETLEYGWSKATVGNAGIDIEAPDDHIFQNTDALEADLMRGAGSRGLTQLTQGIDVAMRKIVSEFSTYPATGPALQAGAAPDSPIDIAKAAPPFTPLPGAALTGWRQKAVTDFQPLIGKWEGFSSAGTRGKKYDFETTYRDDGTYTFQVERGPLKSGRRDMRIADGVYVGKSYKTGESYTIAVYADAHGNHVMKMHRTDGVTWTVAKTKSALSSFLAAGGDKVKVAAMAQETGTTAMPAPGTTRSTAVAKVAPPATPLHGAAIAGWRQKPITNFQIIVGKWEGFVLTPKGKKYDYEVTYGDDGTYAFRVERGMLRSGGGNRIADGVIKSKSYVTGNPMTIALYEDEHGNHVLQAQGADGHTSTVAKAEYALSSFLAAGGAKVKPAAMAPSAETTPKTAPSAAPSTVAKAAPRVAHTQQTHPSAQLPEQTAAPTAYKIAILPFGGNEHCHGANRPRNSELASKAHALVQQNDSLTLVSPPLSNPESLWKGGRRPNAQWAYSIGKDNAIDVILTYWRSESSFIYCSDNGPPYPAEVYLFDVTQQRLYHKKGPEESLHTMTEQALSEFLDGAKRKVIATAPAQQAEAKTNPTAPSATSFEGITLAPGGSVQAINAAAQAYCGSLNKQSRLIAAPPDNPNYVFQCYRPTKTVSTPAAPTTVAKAAPEIQKRPAFIPYKIAIFPFESDSKCIGESRPANEKFASELGATIATNDSLKLAYSYYDSRLNQPPIKKPGRLWKGSKPNLTQVFSLDQTQGVDAVVMYWRAESSPGIPYCTSRMPPFPVDVYVIDVKQRKTYAQKGNEEDVKALAEQTLSRFLAGRRR